MFNVLTVRYGNISPYIHDRRLERSPRKRRFECSNPSRDRPIVKTDSDSSTAKCSAIGLSGTDPRR